MSDLIKYSIEIPINSSVNVLYKRLSTASGLAEWFADDVKDDITQAVHWRSVVALPVLDILVPATQSVHGVQLY